jgi:hypothetical protein
MNTVIVGCLLATLVFVGHRWLTSRAENVQLRTHIAALKRQLERRDR